MILRWIRLAVLPSLLLAMTSGCASRQKIPIDCVPEAISVYVDGERHEGVPETLRLRKDRDHMLFFKGPGYRSELVILRSEESDGKLWLLPEKLCVRPVLIDVERRLELKIDEDAPGD